jgi:hypothetical protein
MKKPISHYLRSLHRDVGFFLIGITIIYCVSGILLIYRNTDFLKTEKVIVKELPPHVDAAELAKILHLRELKVLKTEGEIVFFTSGTYNNNTGVVQYTSKALPSFLEKINSLHKASSAKISHWLSLTFGISLLFLAITSFWMFKSKSKHFRRGVVFASIGLFFALVLLFL